LADTGVRKRCGSFQCCKVERKSSSHLSFITITHLEKNCQEVEDSSLRLVSKDGAEKYKHPVM
jgi:hypothetical protein